MEQTISPEQAQENFDKLIQGLKSQLNGTIPELEKIGMSIPNGDLAVNETIQRQTRGAEQVTVKLRWWGIEIDMNNAFTENVVHGVTGAGGIAGVVAAALGAAGVVTGGVATLIGAGFAAIFGLKIAQINITNNGKGVNWPISWAQWGAILAAAPGGPGAIVIAGAAVIHPLRNR